MTELGPEDMWVCDCDGRHQAKSCSRRRVISRRFGAPEPEQPFRPPVGPVEPTRDALASDWPANARRLRAVAVSATVARGWSPDRTRRLVTSFRVTGPNWWAVWENGSFHDARVWTVADRFYEGRAVKMGDLMVYALGGA